MRILICVLTFIISFCVRSEDVSNSEVDAYARSIESGFRSWRYMHESCMPVNVDGWDGLPTERCTYRVKDRKSGVVKTGLVILADPSPKKVSAWILNACAKVRPTEDPLTCRRRILHRIIDQSGFQFPVAGVVYEGRGKGDFYHAFGFADGVTVLLNGFRNNSVVPISLSDLELILKESPKRTVTEAAPARIIGVTRYEYHAIHPSADVCGIHWLTVVREEHKKAMTGSHNGLIEAWVASKSVVESGKNVHLECN